MGEKQCPLCGDVTEATWEEFHRHLRTRHTFSERRRYLWRRIERPALTATINDVDEAIRAAVRFILTGRGRR